MASRKRKAKKRTVKRTVKLAQLKRFSYATVASLMSGSDNPQTRKDAEKELIKRIKRGEGSYERSKEMFEASE